MKKFFKDTGNFLSFAIALIPSILLYIFQPTNSVPYSVFIITVLLLMLSLWLCVKLFLESKEVLHLAIELFRCDDGKCLCKPNPYLTYHSVVSFYKNNNGFEKLLCYGFVETITERGMVQIVIENDESERFFSYIAKHQNDIIIKPTITVDKLDGFARRL